MTSIWTLVTFGFVKAVEKKFRWRIQPNLINGSTILKTHFPTLHHLCITYLLEGETFTGVATLWCKKMIGKRTAKRLDVNWVVSSPTRPNEEKLGRMKGNIPSRCVIKKNLIWHWPEEAFFTDGSIIPSLWKIFESKNVERARSRLKPSHQLIKW